MNHREILTIGIIAAFTCAAVIAVKPAEAQVQNDSQQQIMNIS